MILAAMLMYGVSPGPPMLGEHAHITMLIVFTLGLGNLLATLIGLFCSAPLLRLTTVPYPTISAVIIPLVVLAAFLDMRSWLAIPILAAFSIIGLLMKHFGWPRPPLVLGFILGPIIDVNIQTALSLYGPIGVLTRPITLTLLVILFLTSFVFTRFMARAEEGAPLNQQPASSIKEAETKSSAERSALAPLLWKSWPTLLLMSGAAVALKATLSYPPRARLLPLSLSIGIIVLSVAELFAQIFRSESEPRQIMDLGMRSRGMEGARRAGWLLAGLFALFFVMVMTIRLDNAAVAFAVLLPLLFLTGSRRWVTAAITGGILAAWTYGLMGHFMGIVWPEPLFDILVLNSYLPL